MTNVDNENNQDIQNQRAYVPSSINKENLVNPINKDNVSGNKEKKKKIKIFVFILK